MKKEIALALVSAAALLSSCGKVVDLSALEALGPLPGTCSLEQRVNWQWVQPNATISHSVDLLFVVDTSLSMGERLELAREVPRFLEQLPTEADTRVAVMLAHTGRSHWAGRLFTFAHHPAVLNVQSLGVHKSEKLLEHKFLCAEPELGLAGGHFMMKSLQRSLSTDRLQEIQAQGFFRPEASLSVVLVSDQNDGCFNPVEHGYTHWPDKKHAWPGLDAIAYRKFCVDPATGQSQITPETTLARLKNAFPGKKITLGAIVHEDPAHVSYWSEDSIGHGALELAALQPDSKVMDIATSDFREGLTDLASVVASQVHLLTEFSLSGSPAIDPGSLVVVVDDHRVSATVNPGASLLEIQGQDAGGPGSHIYASACPATPKN